MKISRKFKNYILHEDKKYNNFLEKNKILIKKCEKRIELFLEKFYKEDQELFLEIFWKNFLEIKSLLWLKDKDPYLKNNELFNLYIRKENDKKEIYFLYNSFEILFLKYKIYIDENWNFLDKDEFIYN